MSRSLLPLIINLLLVTQLNAQINKPSLWNVHSAILDLNVQNWEEVTEDDLHYDFGDFTKKGQRECLVVSNLRQKENPTDTLQGAFLYHRAKDDVYMDNEKASVKENSWVRDPFYVLANRIELKEATGDATKELFLTHHQQSGNRAYKVFTIASMIEKELQKLYQNVSWELQDPTTATKGDTLSYLKKYELLVRDGKRYIKEETTINLLQTHAIDLSLLSNHTYRQYKYFSYEKETHQYEFENQTDLLGLIDAKEIAAFEDYFNDLYKCLRISTVTCGYSSPSEIRKMTDGNVRSCFQKKINLVKERDHIDYLLELMPDIKEEKDISFRGFYLMNGHLQSDTHWKLNGRLKTLLLKLNDAPIAYIELIDSQKGQIIDVYNFLNFDSGAVNFGDKISFELLDFYNKSGSDFSVAIAELIPFCYK